MDSGAGFSPADIPSVFNKFYRGKDAKAGGIGLGLSIVKNAVLFHKGSILAKNLTGGGLCFLITFPKR